MGGIYLRSAVRLLPTARGLGLHSTVEVRDVFRRVEAGGVVVLVCDDPGGSAGSRGGSEWHRASVVSTSYVQDLLKAREQRRNQGGVHPVPLIMCSTG